MNRKVVLHVMISSSDVLGRLTKHLPRTARASAAGRGRYLISPSNIEMSSCVALSQYEFLRGGRLR